MSVQWTEEIVRKSQKKSEVLCNKCPLCMITTRPLTISVLCIFKSRGAPQDNLLSLLTHKHFVRA